MKECCEKFSVLAATVALILGYALGVSVSWDKKHPVKPVTIKKVAKKTATKKKEARKVRWTDK